MHGSTKATEHTPALRLHLQNHTFYFNSSSTFQCKKTSDLEVCGEDEVNSFFKLFPGTP